MFACCCLPFWRGDGGASAAAAAGGYTQVGVGSAPAAVAGHTGNGGSSNGPVQMAALRSSPQHSAATDAAEAVASDDDGAWEEEFANWEEAEERDSERQQVEDEQRQATRPVAAHTPIAPLPSPSHAASAQQVPILRPPPATSASPVQPIVVAAPAPAAVPVKPVEIDLFSSMGLSGGLTATSFVEAPRAAAKVKPATATAAVSSAVAAPVRVSHKFDVDTLSQDVASSDNGSLGWGDEAPSIEPATGSSNDTSAFDIDLGIDLGLDGEDEETVKPAAVASKAAKQKPPAGSKKKKKAALEVVAVSVSAASEDEPEIDLDAL